MDRTIYALSLGTYLSRLGRELQSAPKKATQPEPRADPPGASVQYGICPFVSGPMRGTVSSATVVENARCGVARDSAGGTKRWNRKPAGWAQPPSGIPAGAEGTSFSPEQALRSEDSVFYRTPEMVGRERRGGRKRRAGRAVTKNLFNRARRSVIQPTVLVDSERARPSRSSPTP